MMFWRNTTNVIYSYSGNLTGEGIRNEGIIEGSLTPVAVLLIILVTILVCGVACICRNCFLGIQYQFFNSPQTVGRCRTRSVLSIPGTTSVTESTSYMYITESVTHSTLQRQQTGTKI